MSTTNFDQATQAWRRLSHSCTRTQTNTENLDMQLLGAAAALARNDGLVRGHMRANGYTLSTAEANRQREPLIGSVPGDTLFSYIATADEGRFEVYKATIHAAKQAVDDGTVTREMVDEWRDALIKPPWDGDDEETVGPTSMPVQWTIEAMTGWQKQVFRWVDSLIESATKSEAEQKTSLEKVELGLKRAEYDAERHSRFMSSVESHFEVRRVSTGKSAIEGLKRDLKTTRDALSAREGESDGERWVERLEACKAGLTGAAESTLTTVTTGEGAE